MIIRKTGRLRPFFLLSALFILALFLAAPALAAEKGSAAPDGPGVLTLDQAVAMAREHGYLYKAAGMDLEGARQDRWTALTGFLPTVSGAYSMTDLAEQPIMKSGGHDVAIGPSTRYHWNLTVVQPLFTGFALKSQYAMARLGTQVKELEQEQVGLDVVRDAKAAFFQVLLAKKMLDVSDQAVEALKAQEEDANRFFDQELIPLNELLRSQVALAEARQGREAAAAALRLSETGLNLLIGRPPGSPVVLEDQEVVPEEEGDLSGLTSQALANRPLLLAGRLGLKTLEESVTAAKSAYYPQVGAFASYEQTGDNPAADNNEYSNRYNASVGVQAEWEIFAWGKTRSQVARAKYGLLAARQKILALEDKVRMEVEQEYRALQVDLKNVETAARARDQARENLRITRLQYQEQAATSTDVLNAQTFLTQAGTNYYRALYGAMTSLTRLERVIGKKPGPENTAE